MYRGLMQRDPYRQENPANWFSPTTR
jgi:hypothetical protein